MCSVYLQGKEQGSKCSGRRAKRKREQISSRFSVVAAYTNVSKSSVSSVGPVFFQPQSCYHCYHQTGFDPIQKNLFWKKKNPNAFCPNLVAPSLVVSPPVPLFAFVWVCVLHLFKCLSWVILENMHCTCHAQETEITKQSIPFISQGSL